MPRLFDPIRLRGLTLPNRIVVSPMCQYSAVDGGATDWHVIHLGHLALSGAGLLMIEATGVEPSGRISRECLGLYSDASEAALARVLGIVRSYSNMPVGIQLSHAGRKGSTRKPSESRGIVPPEEGGWATVGPSPIPFADGWSVPSELDRSGMDRIIRAFVQATERCHRLGIDLIEIHAAHGYLLSSFLSPIANRRTDAYGGSLRNRMRFPLEVFSAVRCAWGSARPLGVRLNATDWDERGTTVEDAAAFATELANQGCDFVDVSSGGNVYADIPTVPGYQVPFAARVKAASGIPTIAVGLIREAAYADSIVRNGEVDMVAIARGFLNDPRWPWHAAEELGAAIEVPVQYARGATRTGVPSAFAVSAPRRT